MAQEMEATAETTAARNGKPQLQRRWVVPEPVAALLIVHGIGEHSGRYLHVGNFFAERGIDVVAFDNQGFGRSGGRRGHIDSYETYLDDIEDLLTERRSLGVPVVLLGHSLGGLMSAAYLHSKRPAPDLAVLSAPALGANVPRWQRVAAPVVGRVAPKLFLPSKPIPGLLSRDESVDAVNAEDPLGVRGATAGLGLQTFRTMAQMQEHVGTDFPVPTYVLHGDSDELVPQAFSLPLASLDSVTYRSWPGLRHECFSEPERFEVLAEVTDWLIGRAGN